MTKNCILKTTRQMTNDALVSSVGDIIENEEERENPYDQVKQRVNTLWDYLWDNFQMDSLRTESYSGEGIALMCRSGGYLFFYSPIEKGGKMIVGTFVDAYNMNPKDREHFLQGIRFVENSCM